MLEERMNQMSRTVDVQDEGIPSKGIWNPSGSLSSASSVASTSSDSTNNDVLEDVVDSAAAAYESSTSTAFEAALPSAEPTETEMRMKIYEDGSETGVNDDDNGLSNMLMSSINNAHGPNSENNSVNGTKVSRDQKKNDRLFGSQQDERHRFIHSLSHLSDKQLRLQLWDSFRLARVILGKPIKEKRKLSHKSILNAIRKVAEMKIQLIRMSEELDVYRQREKKQKRQKRKTKSPSHGKENIESQPNPEQEQGAQSPHKQEFHEPTQKSLQLGEDLSPARSPFSSTNGETRPTSEPSPLDIISDTDSPEQPASKLREHAIKILQEESDLALSQIQEIDQRQKKRPRFDDQHQLLRSPTSTSAAPSLFLSPSDSVDDDDFSYTTHESASDILYAFRGRRSPVQQQKLSKIMDSMGANLVNLDDEVDEIRRVLQRVVAIENEGQNQQQGDEPEITTNDASASSFSTEVHEEVISLLSRLAQNPPTIPMPSNEPVTEDIEVKEINREEVCDEELPSKESEVVAHRNRVVIDVKRKQEGCGEELPFTEMPPKEPEVETRINPVLVEEEKKNENDCDEVAKFRAELSAAKVQEAKSIEAFDHLKLQKELLQGDIAIARKNTTQNREELQLQRLAEYKNQLKNLLKQEKERAEQIEVLDFELNDMATRCVKLEDRETEFREKHERHLTALNDFRTVTNNHTEKFRALIRSINRGIKEQTATVFGEKKMEKDDETNSLPSLEGSGEEYSRTLQRLEHRLTAQNMEIFRLREKLTIKEGKKREEKSRKISSRIKKMVAS